MPTTAVAGLLCDREQPKVLGQLRVVFEPVIVWVVAGGIGLMTLPGMVAVKRPLVKLSPQLQQLHHW